MTSFPLLDHIEGEKLKEKGLDAVENSHPDFVKIMRAEAEAIARGKGTVCADDLRVRAKELGIKPVHCNAYGSLFRKGFECVGHKKSQLPSSHGRTIKIWKLAA